MRTIKFRAWDGGKMLAAEDISQAPNHRSWLGHIDPGNLMQYTGLKDKNDVEIYEGDILRDGWDKSQQTVASVNFFIGMFTTSFCDADNRYSRMTESEVIGNTYENPELLEAKQ